MNKRIDFSNLGGFPTEQDTLAFMQDSYRSSIDAIARLCGDKVILHGVEVAGSNVSDGWIVYQGELIPFIGGPTATDVVITETPAVNPATFEDGSVRDVYFTKTATCGITGDFPFSDLVRISTLQNIWMPGDIKEKIVDNAYLAANFDSNGFGINKEKGWRLMSKAYPSSAGRFFINHNPSDTDFNTPGASGGSKTRTLTKGNIPALNVDLPKRSNDVDRGGGTSLWSIDEFETVNVGGSGTPFNIMNPYFVTIKVVKL